MTITAAGACVYAFAAILPFHTPPIGIQCVHFAVRHEITHIVKRKVCSHKQIIVKTVASDGAVLESTRKIKSHILSGKLCPVLGFSALLDARGVGRSDGV